MSLDAVKVCEFCGENVNGYGHAPSCPVERLARFEAESPIGVGWHRSDEEGWFVVESLALDDDAPGYWVSDKHGRERFITADRMGAGWEAPQ